MRWSNQSPLEDSLLLKNFKLKLECPDPFSNGPKKPVPIIIFIIALTLVVKMACFGCQNAVCVNKQYKNSICGVVNFKSSTLAVCCLTVCDNFQTQI